MYIQFRQKYAKDPNKIINVLLIIFLVYCVVMNALAGLWNGTNFLYQSVMGMGMGLLQLVLCLNYDDEIHQWCEQTAFMIKASRKRKF